MIQDRLTAKFQSAKPSAKREPRAIAKVAQKPAGRMTASNKDIDAAYERGRAAAGSLFWL